MSFNVGVTALRTNQAALQVIGHNIANVNTPGFSRQNISLEQIPGQKLGNGFFGKGVEVAAVERSFSQFLTREANLTAATAESANIRFQRLQTLEQLFPMGEAGMGRQLNGFLNSWADVVASPTNQTARGVVLSRADEFARRLNQTAAQLDELRASTRVQLETSITQANRLSSSIATINQRIVDAFAGGQPPNDLLDQRDRLVAELNKIIEVRTLQADDRSITVFAANSVPVVLGNRSTNLIGSETVSPEGRFTIGFGRADAIINEDLIAGGSLKGLLTFYNDDVADVRNQLGRLALSTVELTNRQHRAGLDLNGNPGLNFFNEINLNGGISSLTPGVLGNALSLAVVPVGVDPQAPTRFQASDYRVEIGSGGAVVIQRLSDKLFLASQADGSLGFTATNPPAPPVSFSGGPPGGTIDFDGLRLTDNVASASPGASFVLKPFSRIADQVRVALTSPSQLAVASPLVIQAGPSNQGALEVESIYRLPFGQPASATPQSDVTLSFDSVTGQFSVSAAQPGVTPPATILVRRGGELLTPAGGPFDFVSGAEMVIEVPGQAPISVTLRGAPSQNASGQNDTFVIRPANPNAQLPPPDPSRPVFDVRSNAGNGQALLAIRDLDALDGYTLSDGYIPVFTAVATSIQIAKADSEFATRVAIQAESARANQAGVNLDEEAARLLQFQQAYQASARFLQSMQSIFDTLLSTFR